MIYGWICSRHPEECVKRIGGGNEGWGETCVRAQWHLTGPCSGSIKLDPVRYVTEYIHRISQVRPKLGFLTHVFNQLPDLTLCERGESWEDN